MLQQSYDSTWKEEYTTPEEPTALYHDFTAIQLDTIRPELVQSFTAPPPLFHATVSKIIWELRNPSSVSFTLMLKETSFPGSLSDLVCIFYAR